MMDTVEAVEAVEAVVERGGHVPKEATLAAGPSPGTPRSPSQRRRILIAVVSIANIVDICGYHIRMDGKKE